MEVFLVSYYNDQSGQMGSIGDSEGGGGHIYGGP